MPTDWVVRAILSRNLIMEKQSLIESLELEPHQEGGYFRRTYSSEIEAAASTGSRPLMSSIYYMLTDDSPIGYFHRNRSDIMHYWHSGSPLRYFLITTEGRFRTATLGPNIAAGEHLQLMVPGNFWKATRLEQGEYGLLSEAVSPGFDYEDMTLASNTQLKQLFPELWKSMGHKLSGYCKT